MTVFPKTSFVFKSLTLTIGIVSPGVTRRTANLFKIILPLVDDVFLFEINFSSPLIYQRYFIALISRNVSAYGITI